MWIDALINAFQPSENCQWFIFFQNSIGCLYASKIRLFTLKPIYMYNKFHKIFSNLLLPVATFTLLVTSCNPGGNAISNLQQQNLVANNGSYGAVTVNADFINPWGYDFSPFACLNISIIWLNHFFCVNWNNSFRYFNKKKSRAHE